MWLMGVTAFHLAFTPSCERFFTGRRKGMKNTDTTNRQSLKGAFG